MNNPRLFGTLLAASLSLGSAPAFAVQLSYDFSTTPGDAFTEINEGGFWQITTTGGELRVSKAPDAGLLGPSFQEPSFTRGGLRSNFLLDGDFSVTVDFTLYDFPLARSDRGLNESILRIAKPNEADFLVLRFSETFGQYVEAFSLPPGLPIGMTGSSATRGSYRIERVGSAVTGSYRADGQAAYQMLGSLVNFGGDSVFIDLTGRQGTSQPLGATSPIYGPRSSLDVSFDNLYVTADRVTLIPLPAPLWLIGAGFLAYVGLGLKRRDRVAA